MKTSHKRFVEAYLGVSNGNGTDAARVAGYKGTDASLGVTAYRLLKNAKIQEAIKKIQEDDPMVADREERQRFLTAVMRADLNNPQLLGIPAMKERLKALELLGKMGGDYVQKVELDDKRDKTYHFVVERAGEELSEQDQPKAD